MATTNVLRPLLEEVAHVLRSKSGRSRLRLAARKIAAAYPGDKVFRLLEHLGTLLARRSDALVLSVGTHADVGESLRSLNQGCKAWLVAFMGPAQGDRITEELLDTIHDIESLGANVAFESHHVVETRLKDIFPQLALAYPAAAGGTDPDLMITIALPSSLHRGARYAPLESKSEVTKRLRKNMPAQDFNLTEALKTTFPKESLGPGKKEFPQFLAELAAFYKQHLPEAYKEVTLPGGGRGGIRTALLRIAADTGVPLSTIP